MTKKIKIEAIIELVGDSFVDETMVKRTIAPLGDIETCNVIHDYDTEKITVNESRVSASSNNSVSESKLLDDTVNREVMPETTDDFIQEIPEIPAIENIPTTTNDSSNPENWFLSKNWHADIFWQLINIGTISEKSKIVAILKREDHRDVFVSNHKTPLNYFDNYKKIGTSSLRRKSQLLSINKNLKILPIRGNVDTRIQKMLDGNYDGLVMAAAGVKRLGLEKHITEFFDLDTMLTAPGQGAIAIEIRDSDDELKELLSKLNHDETNMCVSAERSFLKTLGGGCHVPFAAFASIKNEKMKINAFVGSLDGELTIKDCISGNKENYLRLGEEIAQRILVSGGEEIINDL